MSDKGIAPVELNFTTEVTINKTYGSAIESAQGEMRTRADIIREGTEAQISSTEATKADTAAVNVQTTELLDNMVAMKGRIDELTKSVASVSAKRVSDDLRQEMYALSYQTRFATGSLSDFETVSTRGGGIIDSLASNVRMLRGETLGLFFSTLFITMSYQRAERAQESYTRAVKEHGVASEEAKQAQERVNEANLLTNIQVVHVGAQFLLLALQYYHSTAAARGQIAAQERQTQAFIETEAVMPSVKASLFEHSTLVGRDGVALDRRTLSIIANRVALEQQAMALERVMSFQVASMYPLALTAPLDLAKSSAMIDLSKTAVISKVAIDAETAAILGQTGVLSINTSAKLLNASATRIMLGATLLGATLSIGGLAYQAYEMEKMKGTMAGFSLPSAQTFEGEGKLVPVSMPIMAHAGEIIGRPQTPSTNSLWREQNAPLTSTQGYFNILPSYQRPQDTSSSAPNSSTIKIEMFNTYQIDPRGESIEKITDRQMSKLAKDLRGTLKIM